MSKFIVKKHSSRGVFGNFAKFTEKNLCQSSFFNKVAGLRSATLLKKRLCHKCFPVNFVKFLTLCVPRTYIYVLAVLCTQPVYIDLERINDFIYVIRCQKKIARHAKNTFFIEHPQWLLLIVNFLESLLLNYIYFLNILVWLYNFIMNKITRSLNITICDGINNYSCFKK